MRSTSSLKPSIASHLTHFHPHKAKYRVRHLQHGFVSPSFELISKIGGLRESYHLHGKIFHFSLNALTVWFFNRWGHFLRNEDEFLPYQKIFVVTLKFGQSCNIIFHVFFRNLSRFLLDYKNIKLFLAVYINKFSFDSILIESVTSL